MFNFKKHCLLNTYNSVSANWSIIRKIHTCLSGYPGKKKTQNTSESVGGFSPARERHHGVHRQGNSCSLASMVGSDFPASAFVSESYQGFSILTFDSDEAHMVPPGVSIIWRLFSGW